MATIAANHLDVLTAVNSADMLRAFGLERLRWGRWLFEALCRPQARRFAHEVLTYDALAGTDGLQAAGAWLVDRLTAGLQVEGAGYLPAGGALLIVANHPGLVDAVSLFAAIPRLDLRILAAERDFLCALPHTSQRLITLGAGPNGRAAAIRAAARHLRSGGALLTFPAGQIEPDPALLPGARESLQTWSTSLDLFARLTPALTMVPAIVSGVFARPALHHPLTYLRRRTVDRQWLAAILQLALPGLRRNRVSVVFGRPVISGGGALVPAVIAEAARIIDSHDPNQCAMHRFGS